jgi:hypothetical protein
MIAGMTPTLLDGVFVFATIPDLTGAAFAADAVATFKEAEGLSLILPIETAREQNIPIESEMRCITLNVYSSLEGVGLTAAVAQALADEGIACNMVAAYHHDHAFVPASDADRAMAVLTALQSSASA